MRVREITVMAVTPTAQYANLQSSITVEVGDGEIEAAKAEALHHIEEISAQYAESGKALPQLHADSNTTTITHGPALETLESSLTGGKAFFDPVAHVYTNQFGQKFISGSEFAEKFSPEFNADFIIPKMEAKYNVPGNDIRDMWKAKADASCSVGDAIHKALELYGKYKAIGEAIDKDQPVAKVKRSHVHDNPILKRAVLLFFNDHPDQEAVYEGFVVNNDAMLCGSIDRLLITGPKRCRVQDFKTNGNETDAKGVPKLEQVGSPKVLNAPFSDMANTKLNKYWLQLSFYAHILALAGWTVEGLDIFHYNGTEWTTYSHAVIDISGAEILNQVKQQ